MAKKRINKPKNRRIFDAAWFKVFLLWAVPFLILESFFFTEVLRRHNYLEVFPAEYIFPTFMHVITALVVALAVYFIRIPRNLSAKLASSALLGFLMADFDGRLSSLIGIFRSVIPILPEPENDVPIISLLFFLLLIGAAVWLGRRLELMQARFPRLEPVNIISAIVIIVGFIFIGQALRIVHILPQVASQKKTTAAPLDKTAAVPNSAEKPDIYYLVFDRYANSEVLQKQFSYDNKPFTNFLEKNNFFINHGAYANYPYTAISVSSTLNGKYTNSEVAPYKNSDVQSRTLYHNLIQESEVIKTLKNNGYEYHHIGASYGATYQAPLADVDYIGENTLTILGSERRLKGVEASQFKQSPYYRFSKITAEWWPLRLSERDNQNYVRYQLEKLDEIAGSKKQGGRFVFAHILVPHEPFTFNADGSYSIFGGDDNYGKPIKRKFVDQVTFINTQIEKTVSTIQKESKGNAVVILNADEGPYPNVMKGTFRTPGEYEVSEGNGVIEGDMRQWSDDWLRMKYGILQAVYIPKATPQDHQNLSSVNVFRIVLNRYFGYELDYLPECHFGLVTGSREEFRYADISERFSSKPDTKCKDYESL